MIFAFQLDEALLSRDICPKRQVQVASLLCTCRPTRKPDGAPSLHDLLNAIQEGATGSHLFLYVTQRTCTGSPYTHRQGQERTFLTRETVLLANTEPYICLSYLSSLSSLFRILSASGPCYPRLMES